MRTWKLGLPLWAIAVLGLLAAPRVVLHDLGLIHEGTFVNALLVFVPLVIWVTVAVASSTKPFLSMLATGGGYGLCLAIGHLLLADIPPLGGELAGRLSPVLEQLLTRGAIVVSSLVTGVVVGAVCGLVAWGIGRLTRRSAVT
jgi:hypothetical protein